MQTLCEYTLYLLYIDTYIFYIGISTIWSLKNTGLTAAVQQTIQAKWGIRRKFSDRKKIL